MCLWLEYYRNMISGIMGVCGINDIGGAYEELSLHDLPRWDQPQVRQKHRFRELLTLQKWKHAENTRVCFSIANVFSTLTDKTCNKAYLERQTWHRAKVGGPARPCLGSTRGRHSPAKQ